MPRYYLFCVPHGSQFGLFSAAKAIYEIVLPELFRVVISTRLCPISVNIYSAAYKWGLPLAQPLTEQTQ